MQQITEKNHSGNDSNYHLGTFVVSICIDFIIIDSQVDIEVVAWFYFNVCNGWGGRGKCTDKPKEDQKRLKD